MQITINSVKSNNQNIFNTMQYYTLHFNMCYMGYFSVKTFFWSEVDD